MNQWKGELSWILALLWWKSIWKWQNTILTFLIIVAKFLSIVITINGSFSANSLLQLSFLSDLRELRSALIVKCVFSSFLGYTAIMLNIMTMYHMQKASSLPKNLTTLKPSPTISVGVGLFAQSFNAFIFLVIHFFFFWFLGVVAVVLEVSWVFIFISENRILWQGSVWLLWWSLYMDVKSGIFYLRFCDVIVQWNITENFCRRVQTPNFSM